MARKTDGVVVREEAIGPLVWSDKKKAYFLPKPEIANEASDILNSIAEGREPPSKISPGILEDLRALGIGGGVEVVKNPEPSLPAPLSAPLDAYFDYTWLCNLSCGYCYNRDAPRKMTMPKGDVSKILTEMRRLGIMRDHLAGGEPTARKEDLENYLKTAYDLGLTLSMVTNGTLLDDECCDIILENPPQYVSFSLDGPDEASNARTRGKGSFGKTINGIRRLKRERDKRGLDLPLFLKPVPMIEEPLENLERLVMIGIDNGMDVVNFGNPERCVYHDEGHYAKTVGAYYGMLKEIDRLRRKYAHKITVFPVNNPAVSCLEIGLPGMKGCIGGQELITINPDGSLTPCLMNKEDLGNLADYGGSIQKFWSESEKLREFWKKIAPPSECDSCKVLNMCRGGSTTRVLADYKEYGKNDPMCPVDYLSGEKPVDPIRSGNLPLFTKINVLHSL